MASKRAVRRKLQKACRNKIRHESEAYAILAMRHTINTPSGHTLGVYACGDHWHVGHRPRKVTNIQRHASRLRAKPVDWWGEWTEQRERFREDADQMALRAIHGRWLSGEQAVAEFVRECMGMF